MKSTSQTRIGLTAFGLLLVGAVLENASAAPQNIWKKGGRISGTCIATVAGKSLMDGPCVGAGHGNSVFVTAERDGCSIELTRRPQGVVGKIFAYKDECGDLQDDVSLGSFTFVGMCWVGASAKLCLE